MFTYLTITGIMEAHVEYYDSCWHILSFGFHNGYRCRALFNDASFHGVFFFLLRKWHNRN